MNIKTFQTFIEEFKDIDESTKIELLKIYNSYILISKIKDKLQAEIKGLNQSIVDTQKVIDKCFGIMLETLEGTEQYRKANVEHDTKKEAKCNYYGQLASAERLLELIRDKEEADRLKNDYNYHVYYQEADTNEVL